MHEHLLIFNLIFSLLLNGMLYLVFLNFMKFERIFHYLIDKCTSVKYFDVHFPKDEFHLIEFLPHLIKSISNSEHLRVFLDQYVACLGCSFHQHLVLIMALKFIYMIILIINLEHLIS